MKLVVDELQRKLVESKISIKEKDLENIRRENNSLKKSSKKENRKRRVMLREMKKSPQYEVEKEQNGNEKNDEKEEIMENDISIQTEVTKNKVEILTKKQYENKT